MSILKTVVVAGLFAQALAHGVIQDVKVNGQNFKCPSLGSSGKLGEVGWPAPQNIDGGPIFPRDFKSPDIICHKGASPAQSHISVKGGDEVELFWRTWPTNHKGPIMTYLADCGGPCETVDKTKLKFFKFEQTGLVSAEPQRWATDVFLEQGGMWKVTIPNDIPSGNYTMRHEIIAINGAGNPDGAQNYPQCLNLQITASGSSLPEGVLATELYTPEDPGILVDIFKPLTDYTIPGPAVYNSNNNNNKAGSRAPVVRPFGAGSGSKPSSGPKESIKPQSSIGNGAAYGGVSPTSATAEANPADTSKPSSSECESDPVTVTSFATVTVTASAEPTSNAATSYEAPDEAPAASRHRARRHL